MSLVCYRKQTKKKLIQKFNSGPILRLISLDVDINDY